MSKPRRHPTFTIDELKTIRTALVLANDGLGSFVPRDTALEKVANSIAYREDKRRPTLAQQEADNWDA